MATVSEPPSSASWWRGLTLVLLATLFLSLQNNLVKIAQAVKPIPVLGGLLSAGGYVTPDAANLFQVPLLVLLVRITFLLPILWLMLPRLKPDAIAEAGRIVYGRDRALQLRIVLAGLFLLISQTSIYLAIAKLGPATAVTIFFIYPTVTTLLAWGLFGERPSSWQWLAIVLIYLGCAWLAFKIPLAGFETGFQKAIASFTTANPIGLLAAVTSGVVFALEAVIAQSCFKKVNPATFTGLVFSVEWAVLSIVAVFVIRISLNGGLLVMGLLLCLATLLGYLFNNFGIRAIGAAPTSVIASSGPAVTALLGVFLLSDGLSIEQWSAIALVTAGVVLMNLARARQS